VTDSTPSPAKSSTGLDQNVAGALTYLVGPVTGIVFLIIEKDNHFVRFHAMQSTIAFGGLCAVDIVLTIIPIFGWLLIPVVGVCGVVLWLVLMIKAFGGEMYKLPWVGDIAEKQVQK
jgi:uncharacterized membrane protein